MNTHLKSLASRTNPEIIPIFPLSGVVLLPGCQLPLNIFEPRYLNMIDDALKSERLIGMVQPKQPGAQVSTMDDLHGIGGLGRITEFAESPDGRYMIVLSGLKRFHIQDIQDDQIPYLKARISFDDFVSDVDVHALSDTPEALAGETSNRSALTMAMKGFAKHLGVEVDWDSLAKIALPKLVDQSAMISPFGPEDKQSLLVAGDHEERRRLLIGLMHLYSNPDIHPRTRDGAGEGPTMN